jgi:hypothetical protein
MARRTRVEPINISCGWEQVKRPAGKELSPKLRKLRRLRRFSAIELRDLGDIVVFYPPRTVVQTIATVSTTITTLVVTAIAFARREFLYFPIRSARFTSFSM